jgi:hypothetical protein
MEKGVLKIQGTRRGGVQPPAEMEPACSYCVYSFSFDGCEL